MSRQVKYRNVLNRIQIEENLKEPQRGANKQKGKKIVMFRKH